jgi:hypothetical protein
MRVLADGDARPVAVLQLSSEPGWSNAYSFRSVAAGRYSGGIAREPDAS